MKQPPSVEGSWDAIEYKVKDGVNTIYNPKKKTYKVTFRQNGMFVDSLTQYENENFYGVWKYNCKSGWELYMISNAPDNDTFILTPLCVKNGKVIKMGYTNWEAGTIPDTSQNAQVSWGEWLKLN